MVGSFTARCAFAALTYLHLPVVYNLGVRINARRASYTLVLSVIY
jgi:hypothetical protein